ncbi:MAG TPA: hypothetical protein VIR29_06760 [Anseongella sp.]
MKKSKVKALVKSAREKAGKTISERLIDELKEVTVRLGSSSKKLDKEIEKGAKSLAKKLSKELKIDEAAILKVSSVPAKPAKKTATATRTRKLAATKAAASAAPKATAKPVTVARTRKPAAAKVAATSAPSDTPEKTFPAKN